MQSSSPAARIGDVDSLASHWHAISAHLSRLENRSDLNRARHPLDPVVIEIPRTALLTARLFSIKVPFDAPILRMPLFRLSWVSFSNTTLLSEAFTWMPKSFAKLSLWRTMLFEEAPGACPGVRTLISGGSVTVGETLSDRQATTTSASTGRQNEQWMSNALRALCCGGVTTIALPRKPVKL